MSSDTVYSAIGLSAFTVGFSVLVALSKNDNLSLDISALVLIGTGIVMSTLGWVSAKRTDKQERKIKKIEYDNAMKTILELSKVNENINNLVNEIKQEREERKKKKL